ncbi:hypothetical protein RRG08_054794 [Elysia crispata]|uniref:Uncharacterized protein n=1 Tax=Elysia crispata TaxID=231223 RepID=A0AAE1CYG4_9GAST|nr:hypothetical protein RRG08_054794 [Elysia crispata]
MRGSVSHGQPESDRPDIISGNVGVKTNSERQVGEAWTTRDKMLLAGLICVGLIVILLAVIVLLVALGVVKEDGDSSPSS